jgi:hypothetical protein
MFTTIQAKAMPNKINWLEPPPLLLPAFSASQNE